MAAAMNRPRLALSHRSQLFREGLHLLLARYDFAVVGSANTIREAVTISPLPDMVVCGLDYDRAPECQIDELQQCRPATDGMRLVLLAQNLPANVLSQAVAAGVDAVLPTDISGEVLHRSLRLVLLGQQLFPPRASSRMDKPLGATALPKARAIAVASQVPNTVMGVRLSAPEAQILQCLVNGDSNKKMASHLNITEATVKVRMKGLMQRLRVKNRTQAAIWGITTSSTHAEAAEPTLITDGDPVATETARQRALGTSAR
jgi:two-component system, NarL family, nitrate/nitrite response regulator NarL